MATDSESNLSTAKTIISAVGSAAATAMLVKTIANEYLPDDLTSYISGGIRYLFTRFSSQMIMVVDEFDGLVSNDIYDAAVIYLGSKGSTSNNCRLKVSRPEKEKSISVAVDRNEQIDDEFDGVKIKWVSVCEKVESRNFHNPRNLNSTFRSEIRWFELNFHKKYKKKIIESYLPYVLKEAEAMKNLKKSVKIYTVDPGEMYGNMSHAWIPVNLDHPSNFETLAMDSDLKKTIVMDLKRFVSRREYYRKVGKAWKRGYLLYGPPGTGKSSLIAAMANHLNFDIYDLELTAIDSNSDLRRLLLATANRSILVVEDIDCAVQFHERAGEAPSSSSSSPSDSEESNDKKNEITLSGFLNFVDGLWSSCGDERIIIFTTNHKEKLDPALLRPGRMDMHIHMSYCTPCGFKTLVHNYLDVDDHKSFEEIEELIRSVEVTPAEVAEQLLKCDEDDVDMALSGVISFLHERRKEKEEANIEKEENEEANIKKETILSKELLVNKLETVEENMLNNEDTKTT
ncbi:AAA-ATPase At3g50940-like [Impatiens glandulifera]|uniref:AAA-ATPase At3g50940-like n=1 Tax=Impatiens glandulifera TaxID=253017 RepID=UPI001FB08ADA|nr:AAA-ATPase At3g50940-like [Impatiens glandulifera]